jgi:hypothetical protein
MEPEGSLPFSQSPATGPYPVPGDSSLQPQNTFKIHFNTITLPSTPKSLTLSDDPGRATCSVHFIILYLMTVIIFGEEY